MQKIVFLSCSKIEGFHASDDLIRQKLETYNYEVHIKNWDDDVDWSQYAALIFRSTWDYFERETEFRAFLKGLENVDVKIFNSLKVINKNIHKFYLKEFEEHGVKIIPSIFVSKGKDKKLADLLPQDWNKLIIKPAFSGGAYLTKLFDRDEIESIETEYNIHLQNGDFLIQEFIPEIVNEGEISLLFFNKQYSHAIIKKPKDGDFRVQSHFGGKYNSYEPSQKLIDTAAHIMAMEQEDLLYARVDGVKVNGEFYLMEIELIEPDLFTAFDEKSSENFAVALNKLLVK